MYLNLNSTSNLAIKIVRDFYKTNANVVYARYKDNLLPKVSR